MFENKKKKQWDAGDTSSRQERAKNEQVNERPPKMPPISTKLPVGVEVPRKKKAVPREDDVVHGRPRVREEEYEAPPRKVAKVHREEYEPVDEDWEEYEPRARAEKLPENQVKGGAPKTPSQPTSSTMKESYLVAKLRKQEEERKERRQRQPSGSKGGFNELMMENMWQEMEEQISYNVPRAKELPTDFLNSIGLSGEQVLISPRAAQALRELLGGKKNV